MFLFGFTSFLDVNVTMHSQISEFANPNYASSDYAVSTSEEGLRGFRAASSSSTWTPVKVTVALQVLGYINFDASRFSATDIPPCAATSYFYQVHKVIVANWKSEKRKLPECTFVALNFSNSRIP